MKLLVLLAAVACSNGAKLDRNYLPPNNAQTSGGSGAFLQTPVNNYQENPGNGFSGPQTYNQESSYQNTGDFDQNNANVEQNNAFPQNGNDFAQYTNNFAQNTNSYTNDEYAQDNGFNNFDSEARPERPRASVDRNAAILRLDNQNDGETYAYAYETDNGIFAEENGVATNGVEAQGGYSYTGDDGQVYSVRYTAGVNGFIPEGDHLPTPPPIPEEILKALEQNAQDEANGIFDDGSYREEKYGDANQNQQYNEYNNGNNYNGNNNLNGNNNINTNYNNEQQIVEDDDSVVTTNALLRSSPRNQNYQPNQGFGNQRVDNAYLPPFEPQQQGFGRPNNPQIARNRGFNGNNGFEQTFGKGFEQPGNNQVDRNQGFTGNGAEKAYLPPFEGRRPTQRTQGPVYNQDQGFGSRTPSYSAQNQGIRNPGLALNNNVEKAYLPPFGRRQNQRNQSPDGQNLGLISQGPSYNSQDQGFGRQSPSNGVTRAYLPPRSQSRRPNYNARNENQY